ncbi:hypothetical protein KY289_013393 [Solanum tuberosum]|nr:hypothetical protein KY289_013393 [Solanum tuberosum]
MATINKTRPSCARVKGQVDLLVDLPKFVESEIEDPISQSSRVERIKVLYDVLPKYCKKCKLQGHNEDDCRVLHPELKKDNQIEVATEADPTKNKEVHMNQHRTFQQLNPTRRRFTLEKGKICDNAKDPEEAHITTKNPFDDLQKDNDMGQEVGSRRAPTQDDKKDSGDQERALTDGEHVLQKDKEKCGDETTDTSDVVTTVRKAILVVVCSDKEQEQNNNKISNKHYTMQRWELETNGVDEDKGKDTYPEVENEQVDNDGDKTQSQQQMVEKKIEIEGLTEPLPQAIIASTFDSPIKVLHDIVAHNINEINEQQTCRS